MDCGFVGTVVVGYGCEAGGCRGRFEIGTFGYGNLFDVETIHIFGAHAVEPDVIYAVGLGSDVCIERHVAQARELIRLENHLGQAFNCRSVAPFYLYFLLVAAALGIDDIVETVGIAFLKAQRRCDQPVVGIKITAVFEVGG